MPSEATAFDILLVTPAPSIDYRPIAARAFALAAKVHLPDSLPDEKDVQVTSLLVGRRFTCSMTISGIHISGIVNEMEGQKAVVRIMQVTGMGFPSSRHQYVDVEREYQNMRRGI